MPRVGSLVYRYRDCIDVSVVADTTLVGTSSLAMYGIGSASEGGGGTGTGEGGVGTGTGGDGTGASQTKMSQTDHCQYRKGSFTLDTTVNADGVAACHPIPPPGGTSTKGETRDAALDACKARCQASATCTALNIVPATAPASVRFRETATEQNVPWGGGTGCTTTDFAAEPEGTAVCYGFTPSGAEQETLEAYTVIDDDPEDETFFSTCFKQVALSGFDLLPPDGPPPAIPPAPWRVGTRCLPCDALATAAESAYWELSESCVMCNGDFSSGGSSGGGMMDGDMNGDMDGDALMAGDGGRMSTTTLAIIAVAACCALLVLAVYCVIRKRRRRSNAAGAAGEKAFSGLADISSVVHEAPHQAAAEVTRAPQRPPPPSGPPPPAAPELPPGWSQEVADDGKVYYYHASTGESTWEKPQ